METSASTVLPFTDAASPPALALGGLEPGKPTLAEVFASEESPLLRYAYGLMGQRETAEDLVQDAFLKLHAHWDDVANPRAWLFKTVRNLALNHLRDYQRETPLENSDDFPSSAENPDHSLGRLEAIGTLQLLIAELTPADRQLIALTYHEHRKYDQISQRTGLSVGNVGYKLHHALKSLADSLRRLGIESADG
jgi:RNA polymerase sigma-70 factor (ECF subfamily)